MTPRIQIPIKLPIGGRILVKDSGFRLEGLWPVAKLIPNMVLYQEESSAQDDQIETAIVYSCQVHYLGHDMFESIQILSRDPLVPDEKINEWIETTAKLLPHMDMSQMRKMKQGRGCWYSSL